MACIFRALLVLVVVLGFVRPYCVVRIPYYSVLPESLVFLRRFLRVVASNVKPDTKFTKNAKRTKNGEGHEERWPLFVFFLPFFVAFVSFVLGRLVAATPR